MGSTISHNCDRCGIAVPNRGALSTVEIKKIGAPMGIGVGPEFESPELCDNCVQAVIKTIHDDWPAVATQRDGQDSPDGEWHGDN